jgi:hypothetical protein
VRLRALRGFVLHPNQMISHIATPTNPAFTSTTRLEIEVRL